MTQILIAGIGNAWMRDDGFGSAVAERLGTRDLPREAAVMDFGTGGLDLAAAVDVVIGTLDELVAQRS